MTRRLGHLGVWRPARLLDADLAVDVEALGYDTLWFGGSPPSDLRIAERLLDATTDLTIATGIVNMWSDELIDVLAVHGDVEAVANGLRAHLDAGADHVCLQALPDDADPRAAYRAIAAEMGLTRA